MMRLYSQITEKKTNSKQAIKLLTIKIIEKLRKKSYFLIKFMEQRVLLQFKHSDDKI